MKQPGYGGWQFGISRPALLDHPLRYYPDGSSRSDRVLGQRIFGGRSLPGHQFAFVGGLFEEAMEKRTAG